MLIDRILFKGNTPPDEFLKRKIRLAAYYFAISILIRLFFATVNIFNPNGQTDKLVLAGGLLFSIFCFLLLRNGFINLSIILHLIVSNILAFLFTYNDPDRYLTGSYMFFLPAIIWALAIFGYRQRWLGIGLTIFSLILFLFGIFEIQNFKVSHAHFFFITDFVIVVFISVFVIVYYDKQVTRSESEIKISNEELKKTNAELDRFVYSASHDLRAPISSLLGLLQLYDVVPASEREGLVKMMEGRVRKLDDFIREIILYARNARQGVQIIEFSPAKLLNDSWEKLRFMPQKKPIGFENRSNPSDLMHHDAERLRIIVENLISNGIKYSNSYADEPKIIGSLTKSDQSIKLIIEDNGIGISADKQEKIFDMFYRAHENSEGSGLGLYIVKEIVDKMNGQIQVSSKVGLGSKFTVTLPLIQG